MNGIQLQVSTSYETSPPVDKEPKKNTRTGGKHQMAACTNCKRKRKKCDSKYPRCSGCQKSGAECLIFDHTLKRIIPRNYVQNLEHKIKDLELQINELQSSVSPATIQDNSNSRTSDLEESDKDQNLEMEVAYITLGTAAESRYIGNSSAFSIAKAITLSINHYHNESVSSTIVSSASNNDVELPSFNIPFSKPPMSAARHFLKSYHDVVHCQYPFLDWRWIERVFNNVMVDDSESPEELFFMYMIFAIGAQLSNFSSAPYIRVYYDKAMENIAELVENTTLQTVQIYLILSMFSQKMPEASSIWQVSGLAIRSLAILGLHREPFRKIKNNPDPEVQELLDLRARVFWSAYGIERINGIILGRPFGIADTDIDAPLPRETAENKVAIHVIKLRRIQLDICTFVYKPQKLIQSAEEIDSMRVEIILELNLWVESFPVKEQPVSAFETNNWCEISYHNSILLLLRPVVLEVSKLQKRSSPRLLEWFKVFAQSASAICMNYKDLLLKNKLSYSWMTIHCSFVTGLSFLYCLWIDNFVQILEWKRKTLIYDTISSCSQVLYVFAEKFPTARLFRDTFERMSNIILTRLEIEGTGETDFTSSQRREKGESLSCLHEVAFFNGVLNEQSIGIDQYQRFENVSKMAEPGQSRNDDHKHNEDLNRATHSNSLIEEVWEFLDCTGDRFLRDIFCDMESQLCFDSKH